MRSGQGGICLTKVIENMLIGRLCFQFDTWLSWVRDYDTFGSLVLQPSPMMIMPHWSPSESGWFKLNTDGAVSLTNQQAAIRGAFRDSNVN
ncbi:hypothetical protein Gotur_035974 [Gossypium turneri]